MTRDQALAKATAVVDTVLVAARDVSFENTITAGLDADDAAAVLSALDAANKDYRERAIAAVTAWLLTESGLR
jgi:hypothetical protein